MYYIKNGQMHYIDDELYHGYKYIKREWKNGRWVYTYDDAIMNAKNKYVNEERAKLRESKAELQRLNSNEQFYRDHGLGDQYERRRGEIENSIHMYSSNVRYLTERFNEEQASTVIERNAAKAAAQVADFISSTISKISNSVNNLISLFAKPTKRSDTPDKQVNSGAKKNDRKADWYKDVTGAAAVGAVMNKFGRKRSSR